MEHNCIPPDTYKKLLNAIFPIILKNGMKGTTMDNVASSLSMSKRTLYEIFGSKEEMLKAVIRFYHQQHIDNITRIYNESENVIEALCLILKILKEVMEQANADFFRDMDSRYSKLRRAYDMQFDVWYNNLMKVIDKGIEQGVFRPEVNYSVLLRMLRIQMESLKRMEEFLPNDVTLSEAFFTVNMGFLRSIASQQGIAILDNVRNDNYKNIIKKQ